MATRYVDYHIRYLVGESVRSGGIGRSNYLPRVGDNLSLSDFSAGALHEPKLQRVTRVDIPIASPQLENRSTIKSQLESLPVIWVEDAKNV